MGDILRRYITEAVRVKRLGDDRPETPENDVQTDPNAPNDADNDQDLDAALNDENPEGQDQDQPQEPQDPDRQGLIRRVPGAHLVYKRETEEGTYEELWIYNIQTSMGDELKIRREILAGTDIPVDKTENDQGDQTYDVWTVGNAQLLRIQGLPN